MQVVRIVLGGSKRKAPLWGLSLLWRHTEGRCGYRVMQMQARGHSEEISYLSSSITSTFPWVSGAGSWRPSESWLCWGRSGTQDIPERLVPGGFPWQSSGYDSALPLQEAKVWPLLGEMRSHKPHSMAAKKKKKLVPWVWHHTYWGRSWYKDTGHVVNGDPRDHEGSSLATKSWDSAGSTWAARAGCGQPQGPCL